MAKDSPISYLPGTDPDALKANLEYQTALANLKDALDARKNRLFNPALASFAAAMLDPGHGGGFGEALGRSVRAYSAGEEEDIKQRQELAAKNLDVAQLGIGLQRQRMLMQDYADQPVLNNAPAGGALSAAGADQSKPSTTPSGGALSSSSGMGIPFMAPQGVMSKNEFARSMLMNSNGTISKADIEMKYAEYLNKMRTEKEGYTIDYGTGMIYRIPTAELGTGRVPGPGGNQVYPYVSKDDAILFQTLPESDPRVQRALRRYFPDYVPPDQRGAPQAPAPSVAAAPGAPSAGATPPAAPSAGASAAPTGKMRTVEEEDRRKKQEEVERAIAQARGVATAQEEVKQEGEGKKDIRTAGNDALGTIAFTKTIRVLANDKQAEQIFGVLTTPNLLDNVATILDQGVMGIRIAGLEDALRNTNLDKEGIAKARLAAQQFNQLQIRLAAAAKGAVSDYERSLFKDAAISLKDPVQAVHMKNDMLEAKAVFDRNVAKAFRQSKMNTEDFRDSDAFIREYQTYINRLQGIAGGQRLTETLPAAKPATPSGEKLSVDELRKRLDKMRGQ